MNFEQRMRAIVKALPPMARNFIPAALIELLLDLCKHADQTNQEKQR
jgi:hypothetical protein